MIDGTSPTITPETINEPWVAEFVQMLDCNDPKDLRIEEAYALKLKHMPEILYKYRRFDDNGHALKNLEENTIWLSSPKVYNDPFECVECSDAEQILAFISRKKEHFEKTVEKFSQKYNLDVDTVEQMRREKDPAMAFAQHVFLKEGKKTEEIEAFFSVLEKSKKKEIERAARYFNEKKTELLRLCSFCKTKDSVLMWSHYTQEHKGFCIEYDVGKLPREDFFIRMLYPVIYCTGLYDSTKHRLKILENNGVFNNIYFVMTSMRKALGWHYEQEWRLALNHGLMDKDENFSFAPISAVYLGCKIDPKNKDKVLAICARKKIPVFQAETSLDKYELAFKKVAA